jgi:hypothetical protein
MIVSVNYLALYFDNLTLLCVCSAIQVGRVPVRQLRGVGHVYRLCLLTPCIRQGLQVRPFAQVIYWGKWGHLYQTNRSTVALPVQYFESKAASAAIWSKQSCQCIKKQSWQCIPLEDLGFLVHQSAWECSTCSAAHWDKYCCHNITLREEGLSVHSYKRSGVVRDHHERRRLPVLSYKRSGVVRDHHERRRLPVLSYKRSGVVRDHHERRRVVSAFLQEKWSSKRSSW